MKRNRLLVMLAMVLTWGVQAKEDPLLRDFRSPPDASRPGVYWYFMDGNQTQEGMAADLEAMQAAGIRKALFLEVNIGVPRGPVGFMSPAWLTNFVFAVRKAETLGMEIILGTGPGWAGAGGPWIRPEHAMQHLRGSAIKVTGPSRYSGKLPLPPPAPPAHFAGLSEALKKERAAWHADVAVLAYPTPTNNATIDQLDFKSLVDVQPYSSWKHVPRFVSTKNVYPGLPPGTAVDPARVMDLTSRLTPDGTLEWDVPEGAWTIHRFVARATGATTRPAPEPGHGFEVDRFREAMFQHHFSQFHQKVLDMLGPCKQGVGLTTLHLDSWESSSQNWSATFRTEFRKRRGYDPQPFFPVYAGQVVGSMEATERFLWDLRKTAQELVIEGHAQAIRRLAHKHGLRFSCEPYDMNPAGDLDLGAVADVPMCEFWSSSLDTVYSCIEASSIAHTLGRPVVRAEAFTTPPNVGFFHAPVDLKNQTDWAFCMGVNEIIFHTFQHQPLGVNGPKPGMAMGPYGLQWHRNQTFWPMVGAYHDYLARCGWMLRQGVAVADILYLTPEGAPHIFEPPEDAMTGKGLLREKKEYPFDVVSPLILMEHAKVDGGFVAFERGARYRVLVLPLVQTMTPELLNTLQRLVRKGATVIGLPPQTSPSLTDYPRCDQRVAEDAKELWGATAAPPETTERRCGKGRILWGGDVTKPASADKLYPSYASTVAWLEKQGVTPILKSTANLRWIARRTEDEDLFFVGNRENREQQARVVIRTEGDPMWWNPVDGSSRPISGAERGEGFVAFDLRLDTYESGFVVCRRERQKGFPLKQESPSFPAFDVLQTLDAPWSVSFDPAWGGPADGQNGEGTVFRTLVDWSTHTNPAIAYYSGIAVYRAAFDSPVALSGQRLFLSLGDVQKIARMKLNGEMLGTLWTHPYRVEVTGKLKPAGNRLEIEVANTWVNRLVGDQQPGNKGVRTLRWENGLLAGKAYPAGRYTYTTVNNYNEKSPLQRSGLLGPVTLQTARK